MSKAKKKNEKKKREMNNHIKGVLNKIIRRFLTWKFGGPKSADTYIQNAERKTNEYQYPISAKNCPSEGGRS